MLANPENAVCAPCEMVTAELCPFTEGVASNVAVNVPLCDGNGLLWNVAGGAVMVQVLGFTVRLTFAVCVIAPLASVTVSVAVTGAVIEVLVEQLNCEVPDPPPIVPGLSEQVTPAGAPVTLTETPDEKQPIGVEVMV